jgi:hypothetical protein
VFARPHFELRVFSHNGPVDFRWRERYGAEMLAGRLLDFRQLT